MRKQRAAARVNAKMKDPHFAGLDDEDDEE